MIQGNFQQIPTHTSWIVLIPESSSIFSTLRYAIGTLLGYVENFDLGYGVAGLSLYGESLVSSCLQLSFFLRNPYIFFTATNFFFRRCAYTEVYVLLLPQI